MDNIEIQLNKLSFTTDELRTIPSVHSGALISSSLAVNEINSFTKIILLAENSCPPNKTIAQDIPGEIAFTETIIFLRNLSAKIIEYMNMLGDYKTVCERKKDTSMQNFIDQAVKTVEVLRQQEGYQLALWYRNTVTNHYLISKVMSLVDKGDIGEDDTEHCIYLHENQGNSYYTIGEQILLAKLSEDNNAASQQNIKFHDWVISASREVSKLHDRFCIDLLETYCSNKKAVKINVSVEPHLIGQVKHTCLPSFLEI